MPVRQEGPGQCLPDNTHYLLPDNEYFNELMKNSQLQHKNLLVRYGVGDKFNPFAFWRKERKYVSLSFWLSKQHVDCCVQEVFSCGNLPVFLQLRAVLLFVASVEEFELKPRSDSSAPLYGLFRASPLQLDLNYCHS